MFNYVPDLISWIERLKAFSTDLKLHSKTLISFDSYGSMTFSNESRTIAWQFTFSVPLHLLGWLLWDWEDWRRTTHKSQKETTSFLINYCFVDDGIKSIDDVKSADYPVVAVRFICSKANMRRHKFVSNELSALIGTPSSEKELKLIQWTYSKPANPMCDIANLQEDKLTSKSSIQIKPKMSWGMLPTIWVEEYCPQYEWRNAAHNCYELRNAAHNCSNTRSSGIGVPVHPFGYNNSSGKWWEKLDLDE